MQLGFKNGNGRKPKNGRMRKAAEKRLRDITKWAGVEI